MSLYTDRGAALLPHRREPAAEDRSQPADQVGGALGQLGVQAFGAFRHRLAGRSERAFQTLQDRLVRSSRLAAITSIEAANAFIREESIPPADNERFAAPAAEPSWPSPRSRASILSEILRVQEERQVGNDNRVSYRTLKLQIPESPLRPHFVKARVKVRAIPTDPMPSSTGRAASAGTTGRERSGMRKTPLKSARRRAVEWGQRQGVAHSPTGEQNQKKRTFDALTKPDKLIRYPQKMFRVVLQPGGPTPTAPPPPP